MATKLELEKQIEELKEKVEELENYNEYLRNEIMEKASQLFLIESDL